MKRISAFLPLLVLAALIVAPFTTTAARSDDPRPNIVFIFSDDHAYQAISACGHGLNKTPNIDRIAKEGMLFKECYVNNSICGPQRAVIQTGKCSHLNGFVRNGNKFDGTQQTFPKLLQAVGYQTGVVDGRYKLVHFYEDDVNEWELIDLKADPLELKNFYGDKESKNAFTALFFFSSFSKSAETATVIAFGAAFFAFGFGPFSLISLARLTQATICFSGILSPSRSLNERLCSLTSLAPNSALGSSRRLPL